MCGPNFQVEVKSILVYSPKDNVTGPGKAG